MSESVFVSVVAPVRNAASYAADFVRECSVVLAAHYRGYEIVVIDDASADDTVARLDPLLGELPGVRLVRLARPAGTDAALAAGLDSAIGDYVVLLQPELDPPAEIPAAVARARAGHGVVTGVARRDGEWLPVRLLRAGFHAVCNRVLGIHYPPGATRFQVLGRAAATFVTRSRPRRPLFPLLPVLVGPAAATHPYRQARRPGAPPRRLLDRVDRGLTIMVTHSRRPLRLVSYAGIAAGLLNLLYAGYVVGANLLLSRVAEGWTTLSLQLAVMFFVIFLILVVVCEYVGHILEEAQERPPYHVLEERAGSGLVLPERNVLDRAA
jgi:glycosyltransferase involved in cell wall biosynthesis